ncbi:DUF2249 domain-containing protein [Deltaproteobacteria bacterium TL4]
MIEDLLKQTKRELITIDCREMLPPEPLVRVLEAVESLKKTQAVLMLHRQYPCLLPPKLDERKLHYELQEFPEGSIKLLIWEGSL